MTPEEYIKAVLVTESNTFPEIRNRMGLAANIRLMHAIMGMVTETGEFTDVLKKAIYYGKAIDKVNLAEEIGDLLWYVAVALDVLGITFEEVMERNIAKLKARYGDKFSKMRAQHRNLETEREILEKPNPLSKVSPEQWALLADLEFAVDEGDPEKVTKARHAVAREFVK